MAHRPAFPESFGGKNPTPPTAAPPGMGEAVPIPSPGDDQPPTSLPTEEPGRGEAQTVRQFQCYLRFRNSRVQPPDDMAMLANRFINEHHPFIVEICKKHPSPGMEPEDRAQDIWTKLCARLPNFEYNDQYPSIRSWIGGFVRRELAGWPKGPREPVLEASGSDLYLAHYLSAIPDRSETYEMGRKRQVVSEVLDQLPAALTEITYKVFDLRVFGNMTFAEIGAALNLTQNQASKSFLRARGKFRSLLERHPEFDAG